MLPFGERMKVLNLIILREKKKKKTYGEHEYSICEIMRKEKEITASCPVYLKLQVIATVCVKCLVNMEVALNLYNKIL